MPFDDATERSVFMHDVKRSFGAASWAAAALLISTFYQRLQNPKLSKAKALQQAQQLLLQDNRYDHPGYWAAFLMIGNWL